MTGKGEKRKGKEREKEGKGREEGRGEVVMGRSGRQSGKGVTGREGEDRARSYESGNSIGRGREGQRRKSMYLSVMSLVQ